MEHATGVLGGLSLWGIIVWVILVVLIGGAIAWAVFAARKSAKGMAGLDKRLDHGSGGKKKTEKGKGPTQARRR